MSPIEVIATTGAGRVTVGDGADPCLATLSSRVTGTGGIHQSVIRPQDRTKMRRRFRRADLVQRRRSDHGR
jgi:hypothetical protein